MLRQVHEPTRRLRCECELMMLLNCTAGVQAFSSNPMLLLTKSVPSSGTFSVWMCLPLCLKILISVAFSAETSVTVGTAAVD